jgi:glycosyltransferase involved in cell wall biosynthesis
MVSNPAKFTVVIVMPLSQQRGGAETALLQMVENVRSIAWHVIFLEDGPMVTQVRQLGYPADVIEAGRLRQPLKTLSTVRAIARLARRVEAKAMLGWMAKGHLYSGAAARLAGIPALWFQHGLPTPGSLIDGLANRIPALGALACSQYAADAQLKVTPQLSMKVVYAPIDLKKFDSHSLPTPQQCRRDCGLPADGPIIGIFGRLQKWKGMHVLIDAFPAILARYPQATALVVGGVWELEAAYEKQLHDQARQLGIENSVVFAGHQTNVPQWMQACDVIVHASDREPFGMVVAEAMALGKPVVAGAIGGPQEIITDGVDGLLAPFEDAPALSAAILRYLDDPIMSQKIGESGRQRAQEFSLERFTQSVSQALENWVYSPSATEQKPAHAN